MIGSCAEARAIDKEVFIGRPLLGAPANQVKWVVGRQSEGKAGERKDVTGWGGGGPGWDGDGNSSFIHILSPLLQLEALHRSPRLCASD